LVCFLNVSLCGREACCGRRNANLVLAATARDGFCLLLLSQQHPGVAQVLQPLQHGRFASLDVPMPQQEVQVVLIGHAVPRQVPPCGFRLLIVPNEFWVRILILPHAAGCNDRVRGKRPWSCEIAPFCSNDAVHRLEIDLACWHPHPIAIVVLDFLDILLPHAVVLIAELLRCCPRVPQARHPACLHMDRVMRGRQRDLPSLTQLKGVLFTRTLLLPPRHLRQHAHRGCHCAIHCCCSSSIVVRLPRETALEFRLQLCATRRLDRGPFSRCCVSGGALGGTLFRGGRPIRLGSRLPRGLLCAGDWRLPGRLVSRTFTLRALRTTFSGPLGASRTCRYRSRRFCGCWRHCPFIFVLRSWLRFTVAARGGVPPGICLGLGGWKTNPGRVTS
jgi:hypothetical protein